MRLSNTTKLWLLFIAAFALLVFSFASCAEPVYAQETVVIKVRDMGRGMELVNDPFRNDPEAVSLSMNMYSRQPGVSITRNGTTEFINYNQVSGASPVLATAKQVANYETKGDSSAIVFTAGGNWYYSFYGKRVNGKMQFVSSLAVPRKVERYSPGVISYNAGFTVISGTFGSGTNFTRHLQPGDTVVGEVNADTFVIKYVIDDRTLNADSVNDIEDATSDAWHAWGSYSGSETFMYPSGDLLFTGDNQTPPQVIYNSNDTLMMRPLRQVDSFRVDRIINFYADTTAANDTLRKSFIIQGNDTVITEVQLVSRRAGWTGDQWLVDVLAEAPVTYFVRIGWRDGTNKTKGKYFPIRGNSDTAMFISSWYVSDTLGNATLWRDSTLDGYGLRMQDTMTDAMLENSPWAYIYTAVGEYEVAVPDSRTDSITLYGRGAVWKVTDTSNFYIDPDTFYTGMYYIHLTKDEVEFPAYTSGGLVNTYTIVVGKGQARPDARQLPPGDTILTVFYYQHTGEYHYTIQRTSPVFTTDAQYVNKAFFPIRFAEMAAIADTNADGSYPLYIITSAADFAMLSDVVTAATADWEIVRIGIPQWSGMTSWGNPDQMVGWGDTASPSFISMAVPGEPWNWTALNDLIVGDPADPVVGAEGYDGQLLLFKDASIQGYDGARWKEISLSDGLVGRGATAKRNKEVFFLDRGDLKMISRRDFSGHSIKSISNALIPAFRGWTSANYNTDVVPFTVNPQKKHLSRLVYNPSDEHLYLFFPEGASPVNNKCLTFNIWLEQWDGYFDLAANDAFWMEFNDTGKIIMAMTDSSFAPDTALILALDNVYEDFTTDNTKDVAIDAQRTSHKFWIEDSQGFPVVSKLKTARILHRGDRDAIDAGSYLVMRSNRNMSGLETDSTADSVALALPQFGGDAVQFWRPSNDQVGTYWQWDLITKGVTIGPLPYSIYGIDFVFTTFGRDD